jgi:hypothetical protein
MIRMLAVFCAGMSVQWRMVRLRAREWTKSSDSCQLALEPNKGGYDDG